VTGASAIWLYIHPLVALLTVAGLAYAAALGLRSRQVRRGGPALLRRHARLTPVLYWLVAGNWILGVLSVWLGRSDIDLFTTGHFEVGSCLVVALTATALVSWWMDRIPEGRTIHPLLGALSVLLAGFQLFLGLQIMPK